MKRDTYIKGIKYRDAYKALILLANTLSDAVTFAIVEMLQVHNRRNVDWQMVLSACRPLKRTLNCQSQC